jgi:hypothetical protein
MLKNLGEVLKLAPRRHYTAGQFPHWGDAAPATPRPKKLAGGRGEEDEVSIIKKEEVSINHKHLDHPCFFVDLPPPACLSTHATGFQRSQAASQRPGTTRQEN